MSSPDKQTLSVTPPGSHPVTWDPSVHDNNPAGFSVLKTDRRRRSSTFGTFNRVVVVAVDESDNARMAFDWYLGNVWKAEDLIVLVHCPEAPKLPTFSFKAGISPPVVEWKKILDEMNTTCRKLEEEYESYLTLKKIKHKMRSEAMKNVGDGIIKISVEEAADLIVCGSKGTGAAMFGKKGSVAEFISRNSPIPTLIVPMR